MQTVAGCGGGTKRSRRMPENSMMAKEELLQTIAEDGKRDEVMRNDLRSQRTHDVYQA